MVEVRLVMDDPALTAERLDAAVRALGDRLKGHGASVRSAAGVAAPGAKGDPVTIGVIVLAVVASPVLAEIVGAVRDSLTHSRSRSVELTAEGETLKLTGVSRADQRELTQEWLDHVLGAREDQTG